MTTFRLRGMAITALASAVALAGCHTVVTPVNDTPGIYHEASMEAVVGSDGRCRGDDEARPAATAVHLGISECDLVRLQGTPKDIVIAELPDGRRRVEIFYPGPGGATRGYVFIANRLVSTPPGTLKE